MEKKLSLTLVLICLISIGTYTFCFPQNAQGQVDTDKRIELDVQIYSIDLSTATANVNISIVIRGLNATEEDLVEQISVGGESTSVNIQLAKLADLRGNSGLIKWPLSGELGKGEYIPFEAYELRFEVLHILGTNDEFNLPEYRIDRSVTFARYAGENERLLSQTYNAPSSTAPFWLRTFTNNEVIFYLTRLTDSASLPILFWLLIIPTLFCFAVLASTLTLSGKEKLGHRLTVYLALFIFGPTFLMAIQEYLPLRAGLSIPEVLIVTLIVDTACITVVSLFQPKKILRILITEGITIFVVFSLSNYLFTILMPVYPVIANPLVLAWIGSFSLIAILGWNYKTVKELRRIIRNKMALAFTILSLVLIDIGIFCSGWTFTLWVLMIPSILLIFGGIIIIRSSIKQAKKDKMNTQSMGYTP